MRRQPREAHVTLPADEVDFAGDALVDPRLRPGLDRADHLVAKHAAKAHVPPSDLQIGRTHPRQVNADQALPLARLGGTPADAVLSDAAPKLTGVRDRDRAQEEALLEAVEAALPMLLRPGGTLLLKILEGPEAQVVDKRLRGRFAQARTLKPRATRKGSTERYLVARGYAPAGD